MQHVSSATENFSLQGLESTEGVPLEYTRPSTNTFKVAPSALEPTREVLKSKLLMSLLARGQGWIFSIVIASMAIVVYALRSPESTIQTRPIFGYHIYISFSTWIALIATFAVFGLTATSLAIKGRWSFPIRNPTIGHAIFFVYATIFSFIWSMGMYTLWLPPATADFILSQRTFIWMSALAHVLTCVLLAAASPMMIIGPLLIGFFAPAITAMAQETLAQPEQRRYFVSVFWLSSQAFVYTCLSLMIYVDRRKLYLKRIHSERVLIHLRKVVAEKSEVASHMETLLKERTELLEEQSRLNYENEQRNEELTKQQAMLEHERARANELLAEREVAGQELYARANQLEQQKNALEAAKERSMDLLHQKNTLIASFSHDLRQPMAALQFTLDGLKDKITDGLADDTRIQNTIDSALGHIDSMSNMVNTALDLARLEAGQYPIKMGPVSIPALFKQVYREQGRSALEKGIKLKFRASRSICQSDHDALVRIVGNFVSNAIKYTPKRQGKKILVGCRKKGDKLIISVMDQGRGISEENLGKIFREYFQADNPERDRKKGLGLGLSIVAALGKALNHRIPPPFSKHLPLNNSSILADSNLPFRSGSCFFIEVPFVSALPPSEEKPPEVRLDAPDLEGMIVWVLEDDDTVRNSIIERLSQWKCTVIAGESEVDLRQEISRSGAFADRSPDILMADYRLRHWHTGVEAIHSLRRDYPGIPAVIFSAEATSEVLTKVAEEGLEFLSKPITRNQMIDLMNRHRPMQLS